MGSRHRGAEERHRRSHLVIVGGAQTDVNVVCIALELGLILYRGAKPYPWCHGSGESLTCILTLNTSGTLRISTRRHAIAPYNTSTPLISSVRLPSMPLISTCTASASCAYGAVTGRSKLNFADAASPPSAQDRRKASCARAIADKDCFHTFSTAARSRTCWWTTGASPAHDSDTTGRLPRRTFPTSGRGLDMQSH